jgi:hypothetical protein
VWSRVFFVVAMVAAVLASRNAGAQAPPSSFFDGRSDADLRALASDPKNDVLLRRVAATLLVIHLADGDDFAAADAAASAFSKNIDPVAVTHVRAVRRRRKVHVGALVALGLAFAMAGVALLTSRAREKALGAVRSGAPAMAGFCAYAGIGGGAMASRFENGDPFPFLLFALLLLPLTALLRAWGAVGSPRIAARVARGAAAGAAALALAFLVIEQINPSFLGGFGL